jgi:maltose alpha-D-glucosyltransferase/alpha-amylase
MLGGDQAPLRLAYSLQFTLPGTPVLRYGEEIGMGDDLSLPERESLRTPMQWSATDNAGFSTASTTVRPVVKNGPFGYPTVNVSRSRLDTDSLLHWFERMIRTLRECPEVGVGVCTTLDVTPSFVFAHRLDARQGRMLFLHNLSRDEVAVDVGEQSATDDEPVEVFADRRYDAPTRSLTGVAIGGYGYRWLRLRRL